MWKPFASSFTAIAIFVLAGIEIQKDGFSELLGIVSLFSVGFSLIGYAFRSHAIWCSNKNYPDRVVFELDPKRAYWVIARGSVGEESVSFLYDMVARESLVLRAPFVPKGFQEVSTGGKIYVIADGKQLNLGEKDDFICVWPVP